MQLVYIRILDTRFKLIHIEIVGSMINLQRYTHVGQR